MHEECPVNKPVDDPEKFRMPFICQTYIDRAIDAAMNVLRRPEWYQKFVENIEAAVSKIKITADESHKMSEEALAISKNNQEDIKEIRRNQQATHDKVIKIETMLIDNVTPQVKQTDGKVDRLQWFIVGSAVTILIGQVVINFFKI